MTIEQVWSLLTHWTKRAITLGLLVYIALVVAKFFGFSLFPGLATYSAQETGILIAGIAYAIGRT